MDRPLEMKKDKVWSLCKDCWSFNAQQRPSFTEIRERLEKILDKTQRRLPRLRASELGALNTSIASDRLPWCGGTVIDRHAEQVCWYSFTSYSCITAKVTNIN